ncbi:MAG: aldo/keto reductase [Acidimicrobiales bacterium]
MPASRLPLPTTVLGGTGLQVTRLGFGAWAIGGGGYDFAWGSTDDDESLGAIERALEAGVNWIDTAPAYGLGHSEELVGRAIAGRPDRPYVFTKASILDGGGGTFAHSLKRDSILREAEASLGRLGLDAIDLYQIHWPNPEPDIEEGWGAFAELKEQGLVRHIGVCNFSVEQLRRISQVAPVETLQPPYSLADRRAETGLLAFAASEGLGVLAYSPMCSGLLTGAMTRERLAGLPDDDWRKHGTQFVEPALTRNLELVERLRWVADARSVSLGAVAVAWALRHPAVDAAIVGFRRPSQVDPILPAASLELSDAELAAISAGRKVADES